MNTITCPNCGAQAPAGAAFCDNCGTSLAGVAVGSARPAARPVTGPGAAGSARCPSCGESVLPGEAFCGNCGTPLTSAAPTVYSPPPAPSWSPPPSPPAPSWSPPSAPPVAPSVGSQGRGAPAVGGVACPNCGSPVQPADVFCDNCGQALTPSGFPSEPQIPVTFESDPSLPIAKPQPPAPAMPVANPRLVVQTSGATLNLAPGKNEYLIGREDPVSGSFPDVDLVPYGGEEGGVSRRHAQILRRGVQFSIEDLNSVNYTFVNRQKVAPGTPHPLNDGDEIRLGRVVLQFKSG